VSKIVELTYKHGNSRYFTLVDVIPTLMLVEDRRNVSVKTWGVTYTAFAREGRSRTVEISANKCDIIAVARLKP
jgi:hypothetical protein